MLNPTPEQRRDQVFRARIARLERDNAQLRYALQQIEKVPAMPAPEALDFAAAMAHRACLMVEHDPPNGKIHGFCFVCGIPWPCETANYFLKVTEPAPDAVNDDLYYLQYHGSYSGGSLLWWREGKRGYTCDIKQAHVFTKKDAYLQHASRPEDRPWRKAYVDAHLQHHVSSERAKWKDAQ